MNVNHLKYFQEVCRYGNITKASEAIHISQPTVTSAIKDLENELGFKLFDRVNRRISLTQKGVQFRDMLETMMLSFDNFCKASIDLGQNKTEKLKIGIPAILGTFFFERIFPKFKSMYPDIHLTIHEIPTFMGLEMINENVLDVLIGIVEEKAPLHSDYNPIFTTNLVFWANKEHPLAKEKSITGDMLKEYPFIMVPHGSYHFKVISEQYSDTPLNIAMHSNQIPTIRYMLSENQAVTILYEQVFANDNLLCKKPLAEPLTATIGTFWKKDTYVPNAMKTFLRFTESL
jgi:DNA-binding transcriptional LysR family regulator